MKRALAERAKQSLSPPAPSTNAHNHPHAHLQQSQSQSHGHESIHSSNNSNNIAQHGVSNGSSTSAASNNNSNSHSKHKRPNGSPSFASSSLEQPVGQPPLKIPRTGDRHANPSNSINSNHSNANALSVSVSSQQHVTSLSASSAALQLSPTRSISSSSNNFKSKKMSNAALNNNNNNNMNDHATSTSTSTAAGVTLADGQPAATSTCTEHATATDATTRIEQQLPLATGSAKRQLSALSLSAAAAAAAPAASDHNHDNNHDNDDEDNNSAFYLKHQNRALATELKGVRHSVQWLERERDYRRQQCLLSVQALNSLQATWTQLEDELSHSSSLKLQQQHQHGHQHQQYPQHEQSSLSSNNNDKNKDTTDGPASSGMGSSVEWTLALSRALAGLGTSYSLAASYSTSMISTTDASPENSMSMGYHNAEHEPMNYGSDAHGHNHGNTLLQGEGVDPTQKATLEDLSQISQNVSARAAVLQEWILGTVLKQQQQQQVLESASTTAAAAATTTSLLADQKAIAELTCKCELLQHQVTELKAARDAVSTRERRVRRNLYRLSAEMMTVQQVLQTLEDAEGDDVNGHGEYQEEMIIKQQAAEQAATVAKLQEQLEETKNAANAKQLGNETTPAAKISSAEVKSLKEKLAGLEEVVSNRDKSMQELNAKLKEKELRINELSVKQRSEEETKQLESFEQTRQKLTTAEERVSGLQSKLQDTTEKWAQALGNEKTAVETIDELQSKHTKRWAEFTSAMEQGDSVQEEHNGDATPLDEKEAQAKQITELKHKLNQALENVRQAESTRENLKDALAMNESLQAKMDEFKAKYAAVQAGRSSANARPSASEPGNSTPRERDPSHATSAPLSVGDKPSSSGPSDSRERAEKMSAGPSESRERAEKMHREHRRMRKELAAVVASKEAAKAKLERAEKERDGLMDANVRLLKQISEKDEMNAKSLSTILHLKSMTDQLSAERDNLEQQAKSASQLALAARLATNAKERVSEEVVKEKTVLSDRVEALEKEHNAKVNELGRIKSEWLNASGKIAALNSEIANAVKRSDELVAESEKKQEEIRRLVDSVGKAERQASESKARLDEAIKQSSSGMGGGESVAAVSKFTVDQLNTQVSVLKGRLACPVCHYRDKECIIMRCRHMHCRECVDGQVSSRSRKCPTCNNKFSEKDVEDIWLN